MEVESRKMGDGTKLAVAILFCFVAMVAFFFAFHPGGVQAANNPDDVLSWLIGEFQATAAGGSGDLAAATPAIDVATTPIKGVTPQPQPGVSV